MEMEMEMEAIWCGNDFCKMYTYKMNWRNICWRREEKTTWMEIVVNGFYLTITAVESNRVPSSTMKQMRF